MTELKTSDLDQFYTVPGIAKKYLTIFNDLISDFNYDVILEPSAGSGSFYNLLPHDKRIGFDIQPKCEGVVKMDFFDFKHDPDLTYIVIGNPPFGKVSSTAIKFFNKCTDFADIIGFIIPRTFKRISVQNSLNMNFNLIYSDDIPLKPCCFSPKMAAKCCFQIWQKGERRYPIKLELKHDDFNFIHMGPKDTNNQPTPPADADFAIKAYGSNCGKIQKINLHDLRPKSWHWIKSNIDIQELIDKFESLDYSISKDTVRQDSIGRGELVLLYKDGLDNTL
jgi:hypothetical protein